MNPSFEEKSVIIQLAGLVVGLGAYFLTAGRLLASGVREMPAFAAVFAVAVVALVIFLIAGHILAAIGSSPEETDERDRLIAWRAEHRSSWLLGAGVLAAVALMTVGVDNVWTANLLLLALTLSEILALTLRLIDYRRGF